MSGDGWVQWKWNQQGADVATPQAAEGVAQTGFYCLSRSIFVKVAKWMQ